MIYSVMKSHYCSFQGIREGVAYAIWYQIIQRIHVSVNDIAAVVDENAKGVTNVAANAVKREE